MTPADFPRAFAAAFAAQEGEAMARLFAEDGSFHTLTGVFAEGQAAIASAMEAEFAGLCRMARLVTGRAALRELGPGAAILHQRYVVTGLRDAKGAEMPRLAALLTVVLAARAEGWQALSAGFAPVEG